MEVSASWIKVWTCPGILAYFNNQKEPLQANFQISVVLGAPGTQTSYHTNCAHKFRMPSHPLRVLYRHRIYIAYVRLYQQYIHPHRWGLEEAELGSDKYIHKDWGLEGNSKGMAAF